jgi:hypothetical protein
MKIEELIIDGFKSYAVRTTIDKWDATFNAITVNTEQTTSAVPFLLICSRVCRVSTGLGNQTSSMPFALFSESPT